ncbi:hypothetical protein RYX36_013200 [Vicia faba]
MLVSRRKTLGQPTMDFNLFRFSIRVLALRYWLGFGFKLMLISAFRTAQLASELCSCFGKLFDSSLDSEFVQVAGFGLVYVQVHLVVQQLVGLVVGSAFGHDWT